MEVARLLPPQSLDSDSILEFEAELELAAREVDLDPWILQRLKHAEREITINIPSTRADGGTINVAAYRVQHSRSQGPCIGPLFLSPGAHPAELRRLATLITLQSALLGLSFGGAAGAIVCDPSALAERELRQLVTEYISALRDETGPHRDVFAAPEPEWLNRCIRAAARNIRGKFEPAAVVGETQLTPAIASTTLALIRRALDITDLSRLRVSCQGFGHLARPILEALHRENARIIAVADRSGALMRPNGLDFSALGTYATERGVVFGFPGGETASNADVLESDCDLLILAAAERQVGTFNAAHIRARAVLELAQNAVSVPPERLPGSCILIPYLLASCPQLAAWSYEWQQGICYADMNLNLAAESSKARVLPAFESVRRAAEENRTTLTHAAILTSLRRISETLKF